jgi:hypothetical protein
MKEHILRKIVNEIIDSNGDIIGKEDMPENDGNMDSMANTTSDKTQRIGHQSYRSNYAGLMGFSVMEDEKEDNSKVIEEDAENLKNYKAVKFNQEDKERGDIQFRVLPILSKNKILIEKTHWLPKNEKGIQTIQTGSKWFDISEYENLINKFRKTGAKETLIESKLVEDKISDEKSDDKSINKEKASSNDVQDKKLKDIADVLNKKFDKIQLNKLVNLLEIK